MKKVQNNILYNFDQVGLHFCALIINWHVKVKKLFDAPLEPPSSLNISKLNIAYYLLQCT